MAKGDWRYKTMELIGPDFVATRQLTRAMQRATRKRKRHLAKQEAQDGKVVGNSRVLKKGGAASV